MGIIMNTMEIVLLAAGVIIFIASFFIPAGSKAELENTKELARDEINDIISQEIKQIKEHVAEVAEEAIEYSMEKTERSLERLSNEKIMAVNEYSDTVLGEINRNHKEVMFLYDMLNDKHKSIKNTVSEVAKTVKVAEETAKEAEAVVFQALKTETVNPESQKIIEEPDSKPPKEMPDRNISFIQEENAKGKNSNERILELYKQGRSKIAIAKELGLGVGEVKLVIDLFKGM